MTDFMQYAYVFLWAALSVLTFFIGRKQGVYGYLLSVFFVFMAVWYGLRAFGGLPVFEGAAGWVFRSVLLVFLAVIVFFWIRSHRAKPGDKGLLEREESLFQPHKEGCDCEECRAPERKMPDIRKK